MSAHEQPDPDDQDADLVEGVVSDDTDLSHDSEDARWQIEGYLKKKGQHSILGKKRWNKKYFLLDCAEGKFYTAEKHGTQPTLALDVRNITCVMLLSSKKARFDIIVEKVKEYQLEASSPEEARAWYQYFTLCMVSKDHDVFAGNEEKPSVLKGPASSNILCGKMKKRYDCITATSNSIWCNRFWKLIENRKVLAYYDVATRKVLGIIPVEFITTISKNLHNECRFMFIVKSNPPRMYDLLAPNVMEAQEWVFRLSRLQVVSIPSQLKNHGELAWEDAAYLAPRMEKQLSARTSQVASFSAAQLEEVVEKMTQGAKFIRHELRQDGSLFSDMGTIRYDPPKHVLTWRASTTALRVNVSDITDLIVGNQDKAFGVPTRKPAASCCFSIDCKSEGHVFHLESKTAEQAELWLYGLQGLVMKGNTVPEPTIQDAQKEITTLMQQGSTFMCYELDQTETVGSKRKIFLFLENATLYWCEPQKRTKKSSLPLTNIRQIAVGKTTRALTNAVADNADPKRCFAFIASQFTLSLEAESGGKRAMWVAGIDRIISATKTPSKRTVNVQMEETEPVVAERDSADLSSLVEERFKKIDLNTTKTAATCEEVKLWFNPAGGRLALFWGKPDAPLEECSERSFPLNALTGAHLGKKDPAFQVPGGQEADEKCCFTLTSKLVPSLNLVAVDETTRQRWLNAVRDHVLSHALKKSDPAIEAAVSFLSRGAMFTLTESNVRAHVYYRPSSSQPQGYLCWKESPTAPDNPNNLFQLRQLREMRCGKYTAALQRSEAASIDPQCCISLLSSRTELSLQAESAKVCADWFSALTKVMSVSSKTKNDGQPPEGPSPAKAMRKEPPRTPMHERKYGFDDELKLPCWDERMRRCTPTVDPETVFEVVSFLAEGAYGKVYMGVDRKDGSKWALKLMNADPESIRDIQNEVEILKNCNNPFIVGLRGVYVKHNRVWVAMEYCAAGSLTQMMQVCERALTEKQIAAALRMCVQGLQYLHEQGIIHRDLKGANVLVTEAGECKIADFGVSATIQRTLSRRQIAQSKKQTIIGTPCYMAPEVIGGKPYNQKADMWSLGIVAIELATGDPPHWELPQMAALGIILNGPPPRLPDSENWSPQFRNFVEVLLDKNPTSRPTCAQLLDHAFLRDARSKASIKAFVQDCFTEMRSARDLNDAVHSSSNAYAYD